MRLLGIVQVKAALRSPVDVDKELRLFDKIGHKPHSADMKGLVVISGEYETLKESQICCLWCNRKLLWQVFRGALPLTD